MAANSRSRNLPQTCIVPGCSNPASLRHMCDSCYQVARKNVSRGNVTWEELESMGCTASKRGQPSKLMKWVNKSREKVKVRRNKKRRQSTVGKSVIPFRKSKRA
jgi:hypothetical protein